MLDIRLIRENVEEVIERLSKRNGDFSYLRDVVKLDEERRKVLNEVEELKNFRNQKSKEIGINKETDSMLLNYGEVLILVSK